MIKIYKCSKCGKGFSNILEAQRHIGTHAADTHAQNSDTTAFITIPINDWSAPADYSSSSDSSSNGGGGDFSGGGSSGGW